MTTSYIHDTALANGLAGFQVLRPGIAHTNPFDVPFDFLHGSSIPTTDYKMTLNNDIYFDASINNKAMWNLLHPFGVSYEDGNIVQYNYNKQKYLDSVTFRGGKVVFSYSNEKFQFHQLSALELFEGGRLTKKVSFVQHRTDFDYPGDRPPIITYDLYTQYCNRYFLDTVTIKGSDTTQPGLRYGFAYTSDKLGVYSNYSTDYWDYLKTSRGENIVPHVPYYIANYNWYTGSSTGDPNDTNPGSYNITPVWVEMGTYQENTTPESRLYGLVSSITYPTGGKANFEFEENRYESFSETSTIVYGGGYRVKAVRYVNSLGQDSLIKQYTYGTGSENGFGVTKNSQSDYNFLYQQYTNSSSVLDIGDTIKKITYLNSKPFLDNSFSNGAAVLYPTVTEYRISPQTSQPLGKTVYSYLITHNTIYPGVDMTPLNPDGRDSWNNIVPASVTDYKYESGTYSTVHSKYFNYNSYITNTVAAAQTYLNWVTINESEEINYQPGANVQNAKFPHVDYNVLCGVKKLVSEKDTVFDQSSPSRYSATLKEYEYEPQHLYNSRIKTTDSRGYTKTTHYWYPFQSSVAGYGSAQQTLLDNLTGNQRISSAIEQSDSVNGQHVRTLRQEFLANGSFPLPGAVFKALGNNTALANNEQVLAYGQHCNIIEMQGGDSVRQAYLWGYDNLYPVARVVGATYAAAASLVSQAVLDNSATSDGTMRTELAKLRSGLPGAQVWTYTYLPGAGVTSETDPRGYTIFYRYDAMGRLVERKDSDGHILETHRYNYVNQ